MWCRGRCLRTVLSCVLGLKGGFVGWLWWLALWNTGKTQKGISELEKTNAEQERKHSPQHRASTRRPLNCRSVAKLWLKRHHPSTLQSGLHLFPKLKEHLKDCAAALVSSYDTGTTCLSFYPHFGRCGSPYFWDCACMFQFLVHLGSPFVFVLCVFGMYVCVCVLVCFTQGLTKSWVPSSLPHRLQWNRQNMSVFLLTTESVSIVKNRFHIQPGTCYQHEAGEENLQPGWSESQTFIQKLVNLFICV